jgi:hypothetical protein
MVYEIAGYRHRTRPHYFDDNANEDEWQREVYEAAGSLMVRDANYVSERRFRRSART